MCPDNYRAIQISWKHLLGYTVGDNPTAPPAASA